MGFGTTSPSEKLHVVGNIQVDGRVKTMLPIDGADAANKNYVDAAAKLSTAGNGATCFLSTSSICPRATEGYVVSQYGNGCCYFPKVELGYEYKRAFYTYHLFHGNLGGEIGADAKCQAAADLVHLGGTWKAWLLDGKGADKIVDKFSNTQYRCLDNSVFLYSFYDSAERTKNFSPYSGNCTDERGVFSGGKFFWSGMDHLGNKSSVNCDGFTNMYSTGAQSNQSNIVSARASECGNPISLLCLEI